MIDQKLSLAANNCRDDNTVKNLSPKVPLDFNIDEKNTNVEFNAQQVSHISFMFRYSTTFERCLDSIDIVAVAVAETARPLMSLLLSGLTQQVVDFTAILSGTRVGKPGFSKQLPAATACVRVPRDLLLEVKPGIYIALLEGTGPRKSTIIQLIEKFYDPLVGAIYLDGENITQLIVQEYRKHP